jgi:predicted dehydrogenase
MTGKLTALVVGVGAVGSGYDERRSDRPPLSHAGAYATHAEITLVGAVDTDAGARERFSARWGLPCHASLDDALARGVPDIVSVCTPAEGRLATVTALLEAGVSAIWCEKPLAASVAEGASIVAACEGVSVPLQVNFLRRFDPLHRRAAERIADLGGCRQLDVRYSGSLRAYGTHGTDLFRWFAGEPAWVHATAVRDREPLVILGAHDGAVGLLSQVPSRELELFEVDVFTADARLTLAALGEQLLAAEAVESGLFPGVRRLEYGLSVDGNGLADAMMGGVNALIENLTVGAPLPCSGTDGLAALAVQEAVESSLASGMAVELGAIA